MRKSAMIGSVVLTLMQGNIVAIQADAIVNAANSALAGGGGVDGAIHAAGGPSITNECRMLGSCPTGSAKVTSAGNLSAKYIFHAVGPIYNYDQDPAGLLQSAYQTCLDLAEQYHLESIAFPSLSTGAYGYPMPEAATIALHTIIEHIKKPTGLKQVTFVLFDRQAYKVHERVLEEQLL